MKFLDLVEEDLKKKKTKKRDDKNNKVSTGIIRDDPFLINRLI